MRNLGRLGGLALLTLSAIAGWHFGRYLREPAGETNSRLDERFSSVRPNRVGFQAGSPQALWVEKVKAAKPSDFPKLVEQWKIRFPEGDDYLEGPPENALLFIFATWLMKDTDGFLQTVTVHDYEYPRWAAEVLVRAMPEKAAGMIFGPSRGELDETFVSDIAWELAERRPRLFLRMNPGGSRDRSWGIAIASLAETDTMAAAEACLEVKGEVQTRELGDALLSVAKNWKRNDPPIAEWVKAISDPKLRNIATHARLYALAETNPRAAFAELRSVELEEERSLLYNARNHILSRFAAAAPAEALSLVKNAEALFLKYESNPSPERFGTEQAVEKNEVRREMLQGLEKSLPNDPEAFVSAMQGLHTEEGDEDRSWRLGIEEDLIRLKCVNWYADECLIVARMWGEKLESAENPVGYAAWLALAKRAAAGNPERILTSLDQLPETPRSVFASEIIRVLPLGSSDRTVPLLTHLSAKEWDPGLGEILGREPEAYAEAIASLPGETTSNAREAFITKWGELDPDAAACWLRNLPDDSASTPAAAGLASAWMKYDEVAASIWVASLAAGPSRDAAAARLSHSFAEYQPDRAWQWATSIADTEMRVQVLIDLDSTWQNEAPEDFRAELDKARRIPGDAGAGE